MGDFLGDDGYDYYGRPTQRRPSPHGMRSDRNFLDPGFGSGGLYRSRSHGHGPTPTINVYNRMYQDNDNGSSYVPYPVSGSSRRASPRASPESRGRSNSRLGATLGEDLLERELVDMALEHRYRSRSRGRSDVTGFDRSGLAEWQLADRERQLREDDLKRRLRMEQLEADQRAKDDEVRLREKLKREEEERKEKEKQAYEDFKRKEQEKKDEEERQWEEFERKRKEKEEKAKKEKEDAEKKFQDEMRKRLKALGYTDQTIEIMVDEEKTKKFKTEVNERREDRLDLFRAPRSPVYPKVHRNYLAVETLKYYDLPWEYDRADPDYIIILRDMDKRETDLLFEHTSRLRNGKLLLEAPRKEKPEFAWYRRRSRSRGGAPKQVGILRLG